MDRRSKLYEDSLFLEMKNSWEKSDVFKELTEKIKKNQVKIPPPPAPPLPRVIRQGISSPPPRIPPRKHTPAAVVTVLCEDCNKTLDRERETFYTIERNSPFLNGVAQQMFIMYYHRDCFAEIAGEEFM